MEHSNCGLQILGLATKMHKRFQPQITQISEKGSTLRLVSRERSSFTLRAMEDRQKPQSRPRG